MHNEFPGSPGAGNGGAALARALEPTTNPAMRGLLGVIKSVALSPVPVLILGEAGSGKRTLAAELHRQSSGRNLEFRELHAAQATAEYFQKTIAGYPATLAGCGTLFISELADLSSAAQQKLLHLIACLEKGPAGPRIVIASKGSIEQEMQSGRIREDLYYRINGICLRVPPLRHRREDIPALATEFLEKYAKLFSRPQPQLSARTWRFLVEHSWPGNVRELEDALKTIVAVGDERVALAALRTSALEKANGHGEPMSLKQAAREASRQAERELILKVLSRTRWNRKRAAQELKVSYKALLYKLKQIGLDDELTDSQEITV